MTISMIVFIIPLPFVVVILKLDPFYMIVRELFMPNPMYWNLYHISFLYAFSLMTCPIGCYLILKYIFILVFVFIIVTTHIKNYASILLSKESPNERLFLKWFITCRLFVVFCKSVLSDITLYLVFWNQVIITILAWLVIRCFFILPFLFIVTTMAALIGALITTVCMLKTLAYSRSYSAEIVKKKRAQFHTSNKIKYSYYFTTKWRAQQEFPINCGNQFPISSEAINNYLNIINGNVSNSVLLLNP